MNTLEAYNFTADIVLKGVKGSDAEIGRWAWHLPLLTQIVLNQSTKLGG